MGRRSVVSREILRAGYPDRRKLYRVRDDALTLDVSVFVRAAYRLSTAPQDRPQKTMVYPGLSYGRLNRNERLYLSESRLGVSFNTPSGPTASASQVSSAPVMNFGFRHRSTV